MISIIQSIKKIEDKWLSDLYRFCEGIFSSANIPSHDHQHHLRVWNYAKEIIQAIHVSGKADDAFIESCLIASMFHDTGLSRTLSESHGKEGRIICERYFTENNIKKPSHFSEILDAIELHDDKNYKNASTNPHSVYSVVCNADDLDAFGNAGVVRYTEIYLLRGINLNQLPEQVIENLDKRFKNFERTYQSFTELYQKHKERYEISRKFFYDLKCEL